MTTADIKPIELYTWGTPNGWKIELVLDELNIPYNYHGINLIAGDQFKPEFLKISPNNRIPAIVDPNEGDLSVFESGAILTYLAQRYRARSSELFLPSAETDLHGNAAVLQWLNWQMGGFGPMLGQFNHFLNYAPEKIEYAIQRYRTEAKRLFGVLDRQLAVHPYVAGAHYSIADIAIWPWTVMIPRFGDEFATSFPHVQAWIDRLKQRPAVHKIWAKESENAAKAPISLTDEQKKLLFGIEPKK